MAEQCLERLRGRTQRIAAYRHAHSIATGRYWFIFSADLMTVLGHVAVDSPVLVAQGGEKFIYRCRPTWSDGRCATTTPPVMVCLPRVRLQPHEAFAEAHAQLSDMSTVTYAAQQYGLAEHIASCIGMAIAHDPTEGVLDVGMAMPQIGKGTHLMHWVRLHGPLEPERVARAFRPLCAFASRYYRERSGRLIDVKPSNLLLPHPSPDHLVITDYCGHRSFVRAAVFTAGYTPPEDISRHYRDRDQDLYQDMRAQPVPTSAVYGLACSILFALCGGDPFESYSRSSHVVYTTRILTQEELTESTAHMRLDKIMSGEQATPYDHWDQWAAHRLHGRPGAALAAAVAPFTRIHPAKRPDPRILLDALDAYQ
jgi:hypothetical protein